MSLAQTYDFLESASGRAPASAHAIADVEKELAVRLPDDYKEFLRVTDGYAGSIGEDGYIDLFATQQIVELQRGYEFDRDLPGFLLIGSNGGGEAFGFDKRTEPWNVVMVPFIGTEWKVSIVVGNTFNKFLKRQAAGEDLFGSKVSGGEIAD
jgi:hypothetical protein